MLISNGDRTFTGGPLNIIVLLRDVNTNRYHACFAEEMPMPGPVGAPDELTFVRLKSKMHHTGGAATLEEGRVHVRELAAQIQLYAENVSEEPEDWDGQAFTVLVANWRRSPIRTVKLDWPKVAATDEARS